MPPPVDIVIHPKYNPEIITRYNIIPGLLASILSLTLVTLTSLAIVRERENGTMEVLLTTPLRPTEIIVGKVIKRWIIQKRAYCFVIEHDLLLASYLSDKVIVFEGEPGVHGKVKAPMSLVQGMNLFLKSLDVTFRRDPGNFRPRINKLNSQKDQEQKINGTYFT